jgi:hypothetical protein
LKNALYYYNAGILIENSKITPTGTDVMIFYFFSPKNGETFGVFDSKQGCGFFEKNANFVGENRRKSQKNWRKSQKIVITTTTPGFLSRPAGG